MKNSYLFKKVSLKTYKSLPLSDIIENYLRARDRIFWAEGTPEQKIEIEERWKK